MGRIRVSIVQRLMRTAEHPRFETPKGWSVMCRYPPGELGPRQAAPFVPHPALQKRLEHLYATLHAKYPEVLMQPHVLNSLEPPVASRFVQRQLQLMERREEEEERGGGGGGAAAAAAPPTAAQLAAREAERERRAFAEVEAEMQAELLAARHVKGSASFISFLQEEEEEALQGAIHGLVEQRQQQQQLRRKQKRGS